MKLLADENFPPTLISYLQRKHHDVKRIQRSAKTISDTSVKDITIKENRIILTFDKDFLKTGKVEKLFSILIYMDTVIRVMSGLKKRKRFFTATYSAAGLELKE